MFPTPLAAPKHRRDQDDKDQPDARAKQEQPGRYVFMSERGCVYKCGWFPADDYKAAKMPFQIHPQMLRHACGFKLANDGVDTRALQHFLGHRNIMHTVRYTELSPERFKNFWED